MSYPQSEPVVVTVNRPAANQSVTNIIPGNLNQPDVAFHYVQNIPSNSWTIVHNLGWMPNVTVQDSAGNIVEGEISYTNLHQLTASFSSAFSGNAYLS
jgi:hypothetical protein